MAAPVKGLKLRERGYVMATSAKVFRQHGFSIALAVLLAAVLNLPSKSQAASPEQRCTELGAACICSEPLNTNTYNNVSGGQFFDPADSTTKQCSTSGIGNAFVEDGSGFRYQAVSSGEAITALPAGHTNTWILRTLDGGGGQFAGTRFPGTAPTARRSFRFYKYYSTNYAWVGDGGCLNGNKLAQLSSSFAGGSPSDVQGPVVTETAGTWSFYGVEISTGYNQNGLGCCSGPGPGAQIGSNVSLSSLRGKWVRYEIVIRNAATTGTGTVFEFYRKNVTDNGPEYKYVDSLNPTTMADLVNWTTALATNLHPIKTIDHVAVDWFRNGTCAGFAGLSHFAAAAWSTDAGQRIGPAVEIEGGSAPPPSSPVSVILN